ncbi:FAD-binding domain-containing protein [Rhizoctonia solani]|nr:FAD-binding domain-containing protein [Rhizoctonia solani]
MFHSVLLMALLGIVAARSPHDLPASEWNTLNATVGGRLERGVPIARDCYAQAGVNITDPAAGLDCATVQGRYADHPWRAGIYSARMSLQWETCQKTNQGCLLDPKNPKNATAFSAPRVCDQGSVSPYYIAVKNAADVTQGFAFSKRTGVPLSIKNTGHDFAGRSSAPGTLALWINYDKAFVPEGCHRDGVPALTYGAGQDMGSLFTYADSHNLTFIGGSSTTVGAAGGWVQGGGHSVLSNIYGLGADRVLQFKVVTPDGRARVANACQNQDLFWALRGGGGGTFGVVLEATSEVIPSPVSTVSLQWQLVPTPENLQAYFKILVENCLRWSQEGWGGYLNPTASILANPRMNAMTAATSLKPLTEFLKSATDSVGGSTGSGAQFKWTQYDRFLPLLSSIVAESDTTSPRNFALASRLIPQSLFYHNQTALFNAMLESAEISSERVAYYMTTPSKTSVSPAWRGAVWHALTIATWDYDAGPDVAKAAYFKANSAMNPLRKLTPGGGAYQNEADVYEPGASVSFWGSNYAALYAVKQKYDPDGLLDCWHCVGWKGKTTPIASCYF